MVYDQSLMARWRVLRTHIVATEKWHLGNLRLILVHWMAASCANQLSLAERQQSIGAVKDKSERERVNGHLNAIFGVAKIQSVGHTSSAADNGGGQANMPEPNASLHTSGCELFGSLPYAVHWSKPDQWVFGSHSIDGTTGYRQLGRLVSGRLQLDATYCEITHSSVRYRRRNE